MSFDQATRSAVAHRSQGNCEARLANCRGRGFEMHHRQLRRWGDHTETNALHVCTPCHTDIHQMGDRAYELGLLVHGWDDPATIPVQRSN